MIELGRIPGSGGVAFSAIVAEIIRLVIRISCPVEITLMTREAVGRRTCILVVHVTRRTICRQVRPGQRKRGIVVVERRWLPSRGGVTSNTVGSEA